MKNTFLLVICTLLVLLFSYTAISKLSNMTMFIHDLNSQPYGRYWSGIARWAIPGVELLTAFCLVSTRFRSVGLWASLVLMTVFTMYIFLILVGVFPKRPCSCAGVFRGMGWLAHFCFNLLFTAIAWAGTRLDRPNLSTSSASIFFNKKHLS
jgi:putative oxidoreductase